MFKLMWDVKEPKHYSKRVGREVPGVVAVLFVVNTGPMLIAVSITEMVTLYKNVKIIIIICRSWYIGSYTIMANKKPIKRLELHHPMIQFLITANIQREIKLPCIQNFTVFSYSHYSLCEFSH